MEQAGGVCQVVVLQVVVLQVLCIKTWNIKRALTPTCLSRNPRHTLQ
jgi:hypothetical protein